MGAVDSFLMDSAYGYDFVVATTQRAINATMKDFVKRLKSPVTRVCFVADQQGNASLIPYGDLKDRAKGTDPFAIPANANPASDVRLRNLIDARFMGGFSVQLGIPLKYSDPRAIPDYVILGSETSRVTFNMLCSQFDAVALTPGGGYASTATWAALSQGSGEPWIIQSWVDLRLSACEASQYGSLPAAVQAAIKNLGADAFSIRQLLLDLTRPALTAGKPQIQGIAPGTPLYSAIQDKFLDIYFQEMRKGGEPLIGVAVTHRQSRPSTLTMTDLNLQVCPFVDAAGKPVVMASPAQQGAATLSYLCAVENHELPRAVPFKWNWVDESQIADYHGVIAIKRKTFAGYLARELRPQAQKCCFILSAKAELDGLSTKGTLKAEPGGFPAIEMPESGTTLFKFKWDAIPALDKAGVEGNLLTIELKSTYELAAEVNADKLTISQTLVVYVCITSLSTTRHGNLVNRKITDEYAVTATDDGQLQFGTTASTVDSNPDANVTIPGAWGDFVSFFNNINSMIDQAKDWATRMSNTGLTSVELNKLRNFVFPAGQTFSFKQPKFSRNGDLTAAITYVRSV